MAKAAVAEEATPETLMTEITTSIANIPATYVDTAREICARAEPGKGALVQPKGSALLTILNDDGYREAVDIVKAIDYQVELVKQTHRPQIALSDKLHKMLLSNERRDLDKMPELRKVIAAAIGRFSLQKQEEARRVQEAEQARLRKIEDAKRQKEAKALERHGNPEAAAAVLAAPSVAPTVEVRAAVPEVEGVSFSEHWRAELVDKDQLIDAVSEGRVPPEALEVNMTFLNGQARQFKQTLNYPGVRPVMEKRPRVA